MLCTMVTFKALKEYDGVLKIDKNVKENTI